MNRDLPSRRRFVGTTIGVAAKLASLLIRSRKLKHKPPMRLLQQQNHKLNRLRQQSSY